MQRDFELLGAAVGDVAFVRAHTAERAAKAGDLLDSLGELEDPQVALRLLRACAGFARMLHSMRCNPVTAQTMALDMFDGMLRRSFGDFTGLHLTAAQWQQASLGLAHGGLGLRSTSQHAAAAFLASWASTLTSAAELDATFLWMKQKLAQTSLPPLPPLTPSFRQVKPSVSIPLWATIRQLCPR